MEARELRIGNYVACQWEEAENGIITVRGSHISLGDATGGIESFNPIPLTEEWLLKFGFEKDGKWLYHPQHFVKFKFRKDGTIWRASIIDSSFGSGFSRSKNNRLMYIHQLQNLYFALTGQELTLSTVSRSQSADIDNHRDKP